MVRICQFCRFSFIVEGQSRPIPACSRKKGRHPRTFVIDLAGTCPNFEPTADPPIISLIPGLAALPDLDNIRIIPLTLGRFAIVSAEDYLRLSCYLWHCIRTKNNYYVSRRISTPTGTKYIQMHRVIMSPPDHLVVDHINRNGLDNRRSNLRICTPAQNNFNTCASRNSSSKYKGVTWHKASKKFRANISLNRIPHKIGSFKNEIDAAKAYDKKARELFKEYAFLNFPDS